MTPLLFSALLAASPSQAVEATVDAGRTSAPISKCVYGQFVAHGVSLYTLPANP